ncbi:MAG: aminotransferase [Lachnospiraceae bacterium]|nr:aminotransferase [Lachnospiraceae bacterium]
MESLKSMSKEQLLEMEADLEKQFEDVKGKGISLDMSRGKPAPAQLDMGNKLFDALGGSDSMLSENGMDCRNYGGLEGIPEARKLMADILEVSAENVIVCGNASLPIMYDAISRSMNFGVCGSTPWCKLEHVKFLCPVPGYDRHFKITELFGIEMINIPMTEDGPDMDLVEKYVNGDPMVKGIWCVPKYSNPSGITYSDDTVRRLAGLKPAAEDFRIYWDNAYCVHDLYEDKADSLLEILGACVAAGNPDLVFEFASMSKISMAGAGIACVVASANNLNWMKSTMTVQTIGFDKTNMLRHVRYFMDANGVRAHMLNHARILRPKFEATWKVLEKELGGLDIGTWTKPLGGYFISFDSMDGCAKDIVAKCKEAGLVLTGAGATYPYGKDPQDKNIRIAPSYPTVEEMEQAAELFTLCVKLVSVKKLLSM